MSQKIAKDEELVRGVFSRSEAKIAKRDKNPTFRVFLEREGAREISVDRFSRTTPEAAAAVAREVARNRGENRNFYGWAMLTVWQAEENNRRVKESPIEGNPHHADIILPSDTDDIEYEEQVKHARELADSSRWQHPPD